MDIEQIRAYCLSKPHATEDFPFDETTLVFRVMNKIFASIGLDNVDWFCLKCDPEYAIELREHYTGITMALEQEILESDCHYAWRRARCLDT